MTVQDLILLLPDTLLKALSSEDATAIDETVLEKLLTKSENLATALNIAKSAMKEEFVFHNVLTMLYERFGLFEQARMHQEYITKLLENFEKIVSTEDAQISYASKEKQINENDARMWWWW